MSYLKVNYVAAVNGQTHFSIPKDNISYVVAGPAVAGNATVNVFLKQAPVGVAGDALQIQFGQAASAAGYSLVDAVSEAWTSNPGGIVSLVGGIPLTLSATGQALTFCTITGVTAV